MTTPRYILHRTLDTGDESTCWREEVADEALTVLRPLLDQAIESGDHVAIPTPPAEGDALDAAIAAWRARAGAVPPAHTCTITATRGRARALMVTIWGPPWEGRPVPLVTLGIAPTSLAGAEVWQVMRRDGDPPRRELPLPAPWCAARIQPSIVVHMSTSHWLGDLDRCIAWAWIERPTKTQEIFAST